MTIDDSEQNRLVIRVLVANMSGILLEIVMQAIQQQPDMTISHYQKDLDDLAEAVGNQIDVLMIGAPYVYPPPAICRKLWISFPRLKVLVLTPSGNAAVLHWLSVRQKRLKTVSVPTLTNAIRQVQRLDLTDE